MKSYILYNPKAGEGEKETVLAVKEKFDAQLVDLTGLESHSEFIKALDATDVIIIAGGDGTLNRFINETAELEYENDVYYFPHGSGNDFWHDVASDTDEEPMLVNKYLKNLPTVEIDGAEYRFLNGVGFGIDGYCCEEGDRLKEKSDKPANYTMIAIKGLLFKYKPCGATVTVDGVRHRYEKVWIAPTMKGRYYGGGMMTAPEQDRLSEDGIMTTVIFHDSSKLRTLMIFPGIFKGEHIRHEKFVAVHTGYDITVEFDEPRPLQVDGETHIGVKSYRAVSKKEAEIKA